MAEPMQRQRLSAFMDGELPADECPSLVAACRADADLDGDWRIFHCIGDVLRSADMACHSDRLVTRVMAAIEVEPAILAPASFAAAAPRAARPRRAWMSWAAAGAAVAVIGGLVFPQWNVQREPVAAAPAPVAAGAPVAATGPAAARSWEAPLNVSGEYLAAHRQYAAGMAVPVAASR
jgi:sigma-E factor negative regulatory protein RseA